MEYIGGQVITQSKAVEKQIFNAIASALGKQRFDLWFGHETSVQIENNKIIFSVQEHVVNWIRSSLQTEIEQACESVLKKKSIVEFIVAAENSTVRDNSTLLPNNRADKINQPFLPNPQPTREIYEIHFDSNAIETPTNSTLPIATENAATAPNKFDLNSNQNIIKQQNSRHSKFSNAIIHDTKNSNSNNSNNSINGNINININNTKNTNDNNIDLKPPTGFIQSRSGVQSRYVKSPITSSTSPIANIPRTNVRKFASIETFVEGLSNRLAIRGIDFALNHSCLINPIYIYGSSGVGKTHLLEGLWSRIRSRVENKPPLYMTTEQFVSGFLDGIQSGSSRNGSQGFRDRFKGISYFLLDDIQYLNRKEATQTEFLYVMGLLKSNGVQIVLTADRPLSELGLRGDIISRLESGMSCGIELPERELLLSITRGMIERRGMKIGDDVCRFICSRVGMNARRISGALNRLLAISKDAEEITVETAEESLKDMLQGVQRDVRLSDIGKIVSDEFGLSEGVLQSRERSRQLNVPRMLAMWLARKYTRFALAEIGRFFGERSHSSVVTAQKKVEQWIDSKSLSCSADQNINITQTLQNLERKISGI